MRIIVICLILAFVASGCKKNEVVLDIDHSSKYQPLAVGHTWIYQVDSISFYGNISQRPDTFHFLQRNTVESSFTNEQGQLSYRVTRSVKRDSLTDWVFQRNYSLTKTDIDLLQTFEDETTIEFTLPFVLLREWDCNQFNYRKSVDCYFEEIHTPMYVGTQNFDSTSTVYSKRERNAVNSFFNRKTYAANIGIVLQYVEGINNVDSDPKGTKYSLTLVSFEK